MTVGEAKDIARDWAARRARELPDFAGAYLDGSIMLKEDTDPFPSTSDVDIQMALNGEGHDVLTEVDGEFRAQAIEYRGLDIEPMYPSIKNSDDPDKVLGSWFLAPAFSRPNVLLDPTGVLTRVQHVAAAAFRQERWVRKRCEGLRDTVLSGLGQAARREGRVPGWASDPAERLGWLYTFSLTLAAGLPCVAAHGGVTNRRALPAARAVLEKRGMQDLYRKMLEVVGCERVTEPQATDFLAETEQAFDCAIGTIRTHFWSDFNYQEFMRPKIIGGARQLLDDGYHREAMHFLVYVRNGAQNAIENDGSAEQKERFREGYRRLLSALGIGSPVDITRKVGSLERLLPDLIAAAEIIIEEGQS